MALTPATTAAALVESGSSNLVFGWKSTKCVEKSFEAQEGYYFNFAKKEYHFNIALTVSSRIGKTKF